jgi:hypothetical protein
MPQLWQAVRYETFRIPNGHVQFWHGKNRLGGGVQTAFLKQIRCRLHRAEDDDRLTESLYIDDVSWGI